MKKKLTLSIDETLLKRAKELDLNISLFLELRLMSLFDKMKEEYPKRRSKS
jgi:post-segregation antitoxin (ccd killing protein)